MRRKFGGADALQSVKTDGVAVQLAFQGNRTRNYKGALFTDSKKFRGINTRGHHIPGLFSTKALPGPRLHYSYGNKVKGPGTGQMPRVIGIDPGENTVLYTHCDGGGPREHTVFRLDKSRYYGKQLKAQQERTQRNKPQEVRNCETAMSQCPLRGRLCSKRQAVAVALKALPTLLAYYGTRRWKKNRYVLLYFAHVHMPTPLH